MRCPRDSSQTAAARPSRARRLATRGHGIDTAGPTAGWDACGTVATTWTGMNASARETCGAARWRVAMGSQDAASTMYSRGRGDIRIGR